MNEKLNKQYFDKINPIIEPMAYALFADKNDNEENNENFADEDPVSLKIYIEKHFVGRFHAQLPQGKLRKPTKYW